uniref:Uncharacterized protein n=1 Tax=Anopheles coluzzii TaxID=1518534 RepID=A0A8W7PDT5_ANOCL
MQGSFADRAGADEDGSSSSSIASIGSSRITEGLLMVVLLLLLLFLMITLTSTHCWCWRADSPELLGRVLLSASALRLLLPPLGRSSSGSCCCCRTSSSCSSSYTERSLPQGSSVPPSSSSNSSPCANVDCRRLSSSLSVLNCCRSSSVSAPLSSPNTESEPPLFGSVSWQSIDDILKELSDASGARRTAVVLWLTFALLLLLFVACAVTLRGSATDRCSSMPPFAKLPSSAGRPLLYGRVPDVLGCARCRVGRYPKPSSSPLPTGYSEMQSIEPSSYAGAITRGPPEEVEGCGVRNWLADLPRLVEGRSESAPWWWWPRCAIRSLGQGDDLGVASMMLMPG